jgi:hypothetical protein
VQGRAANLLLSNPECLYERMIHDNDEETIDANRADTLPYALLRWLCPAKYRSSG